MRARTAAAVLIAACACLPLAGLGRGEEGRDGVPGTAPPGSSEADARTRGGSTAERSGERNELVDRFIVGNGITDPETVQAMRTVPRHLFLPANLANRAYFDMALPIGYGQTISQPYVVAFMTEALALEASDKVLEIGTGSGYQAAVLAEIVGEVYSIEIVPELEAQVHERLARLGYGAVHLKGADGYFGWEEEAPFDKMIVTAAVDHVPPPLLQQLAPGGRLILPLGSPGGIQTLLLITKMPDGTLERTSLLSVRFVPLTGRALQ